MNQPEYYALLHRTLSTSPYVVAVEKLLLRDADNSECRVTGRAILIGDLHLHISEYVVLSPIFTIVKYRYHLQRGDSQIVVRWDNAPHHPWISTYPNHAHLADGTIAESFVRGLGDVMALIDQYLD